MNSQTSTVATVEPAPEQDQSLPISMASVKWAAAAGIALFGVFSLLSTDDGPVLCPYRRCTDGYCPGCGLTRAGGHLLRGQLGASWAQHPYIVFLAAQLPIVGLTWIAGSAKVKARLFGAKGKILAVNAVLLLGIWVFRLASGEIPLPFPSHW